MIRHSRPSFSSLRPLASGTGLLLCARNLALRVLTCFCHQTTNETRWDDFEDETDATAHGLAKGSSQWGFRGNFTIVATRAKSPRERSLIVALVVSNLRIMSQRSQDHHSTDVGRIGLRSGKQSRIKAAHETSEWCSILFVEHNLTVKLLCLLRKILSAKRGTRNEDRCFLRKEQAYRFCRACWLRNP